MGVPRPAAAASIVALALALAIVAPRPAAASEPFRNGQATATAQVVRIGPGVGALALATTIGTTAAQIANKLAQAQAQAIDLGLVGSSLTAQGCDGSAGAVRPDQLPQSVFADNRKGNSTVSGDEIPVVPDILGGGHKAASASTTPSSEATVDGIRSSIASLVTISGGRADSTTRIVDKVAREADATSTVSIDLAGIVHLDNAQWRAVHRTGASPSVAGTFSITSGTAGGVPLPVDQLVPLQAAINTALATTGITVDLPHVVHITKPNDVIRVTPLVIQMKDSPAGKTALGPVLNASRAQREQLFTTIASKYCQAAGALLVGDIGMDIMSGTGFLTIEVGGVDATSADLGLFNPFGSNDPLGVLGGVITNFTPGSSSLPSLAATGISPPVQSGETALVPVRNVCESLSKSTRVGCSKGAALPVGIIGIALTATIGGLDWRRRRVRATTT